MSIPTVNFSLLYIVFIIVYCHATFKKFVIEISDVSREP